MENENITNEPEKPDWHEYVTEAPAAAKSLTITGTLVRLWVGALVIPIIFIMGLPGLGLPGHYLFYITISAMLTIFYFPFYDIYSLITIIRFSGTRTPVTGWQRVLISIPVFATWCISMDLLTMLSAKSITAGSLWIFQELFPSSSNYANFGNNFYNFALFGLSPLIAAALVLFINLKLLRSAPKNKEEIDGQ